MREIKFRVWDGEKMVYLSPLETENENRGLICLGEIDKEPVEVMQYTGLNDKNGVEIYDGDIVKCLDGYNALVSWNEKHTGWHPFGSYEGAEWDKSVEVIGNRYEHPNLLKE